MAVRSCTNCHARHLKCIPDSIDHSGQNACKNCTELRMTCTINRRYQFRHGGNPSVVLATSVSTRREYDFDDEQPWVKIRSTLTFINEGPELRSIYGAQDALPGSSRSRSRSEEGQDSRDPSYHLLQDGVNQSNQVISVTPALVSLSDHRRSEGNRTPTADPCTPQLVSPLASQTVSSSCLRPSTVSPGHSLGSPTELQSLWALRTVGEAQLMQHFTHVLAGWFDLFDPQRHFALLVPHRATTCSTLRKAIFALSARHLGRHEKTNQYLADRYYEECIEELIPMFDEIDTVLDEGLLCATVILRLLEELDVALTGYDNQHHLRGIQALVCAQENAGISPSGLRQAAFWTGFHQEVFMAFITRRPISHVLLTHAPVDRSLSGADDRTWTCRILVHCAHILEFCYGESEHDDQLHQTRTGYSTVSEGLASESQTRWQSLLNYVQKWRNACPFQFEPMFSESSPQDSFFPALYYHLPVYVTAAMYYHLCLILLALKDPMLDKDSSLTRDRTGNGRVQEMRHYVRLLKNLDEKIRHNVRALCGIAICNGYLAPATTMAGTALAVCGEHFVEDVDRKEQEALLDLLLQNETQHGWPTGAARHNLKNLWNWTDVE